MSTTTVAPKGAKPSDYKLILAWGRAMHSFSNYIVHEQEKACAAGAPVNAIYERHANDGSGPTGVWSTADQISNPQLREWIHREVAAMK